jgi:hypothetical protein
MELSPKLALHISRMRLQSDDYGPVRGNQQPDSVEGLAQERSGSEQGRKLLRSVVATHVSDEPATPGAFASRKHYGPERSTFARLAPFAPRLDHDRVPPVLSLPARHHFHY